jgi:aminopeptidase N
MKKIVVVFILCFIIKSTYAQLYGPDMSSRFNKVFELLKKKEYHIAIEEMDYILSFYPNHAGMIFNRGLAKFYLNDQYGAREDLIKAKILGLKERDKIINSITSKSFLVNILTESYLDKNTLDSTNGFKMKFGLKDSLQGALRPERTCYDVYFYNLSIKIQPKTKSIEGSNQIYFKTVEKTNRIQIDLSDSFRINSINWNGKELKYSRVFNAIYITFDEYLPVNEKQMITIKYSGKPRVAPSPPWNGGFVWNKKKGKWWIGVACEHLGASSWWPCKDHLSEKPDSMGISIQVPTGLQAISNGYLRSSQVIDKEYTNFEWFVSYPINSYCVTFYAGNFINFNETYTNKDGSYIIDYYVLPHNLKRAQKYYSQTKDIVNVFEKVFGEYPYAKDGMAMVEAPYTGMEHQSAIAIGDEYGRKKRRGYEKTDYDYLVVHETAHEWWGNTVTMGDMADAWISEGFATYAEHIFMEEKYGYPEYISASAVTMGRIFNIWPIVGIKDVNDNSFIGGDIYHKGAAMLNNLRCTINNDSLFFSIIKTFYNNFKFKIAKSSDFVQLVNERTGKDYSDFFNKFLYGTDPPILQYKYSLVSGSFSLTYKWINVGKNFTMPFSITINDSINNRLIGTTEAQTIKFQDVKSFYLPNENRFEKEKISKNAFTYYWTSNNAKF